MRPHIEPVITTKERIAQAALMLFAQKGYRAVSIRDICRIVEIKESTIYYHYQNKQAIMDTLIAKVHGIIEIMQQRFDQTFAQTRQISEAAMCDVAVGILDNYLLHPDIYPLVAVLSIERMADPDAAAHYRQLLFEAPQRQQERVFADMMARGDIAPSNAAVLARQYQAVIYYSFQKNCLGASVDELSKDAARQEIRAGILDIYRKMKAERNL